MFNSWYYVKELAKNLNKNLNGILFQTPFTYKKNEIYIPYSGNDRSQCLHMVIKNPVPYFMTENNIPKQKHVVKVLKQLTGCVLQEVLFHKNDRQILFVMNDNREYLLFQIYGINGNIFLLDKNFEVVEQFKNRKNFEIPDKTNFVSKESPSIEISWLTLFQNNQDKTLFQFLKLLPLKFFSENLRNEICFQLNVDPNDLVYNLSLKQQNHFINLINDIRVELVNPSYYYYKNDIPILSFLKLNHLNIEMEKLDDFFELQRIFIGNSFRDFNFINLKKKLLTKISNYYEVIVKRLTKSIKSLNKLPESHIYREYGDAILINVRLIKKGQKEVVLQSYVHPEKNLTISLDPKLPASKNADIYFKKAYKIDGAKKELKNNIQILSIEKNKIQILVNNLESAESFNQLKTIENELPIEIIQQNLRDETNIRVPYKKYYYKNWEILVGKSAQDNDELTFKVATKMDFWLHASKVPGSHVIVKNPEKKENLPEEILLYSAGIAAFFSKIKNSGVVPVNYTKKKYVWKRKKMTPGQVFINF